MTRRFTQTIKMWAVALLAACLTLTAVIPALAAATPMIQMVEGGVQTIPVENIDRYVVGAPNVLDARVTGQGLSLTAKRAGNTTVCVWRADGIQSRYQVRVSGAAAAGMAGQTGGNTIEMQMAPGDSELLTGVDIIRTSVSDPAIVDIVPVSTGEVLANAKTTGSSTVRIWDAKGLATYVITVGSLAPSAEEVAATIAANVNIPTVNVTVAGESVILTGVAPNAAAAQKAVAVAETSGKTIVDLISVESNAADTVIASLMAALPDLDLNYEQLPDETVLITGAVESLEDARKVQEVVAAWTKSPEAAEGSESKEKTLGGEYDYVDSAEVSDVIARRMPDETIAVDEDFKFSRKVFGGRMDNGGRLVAIIDVNPALARQVLVSTQVVEIDRSKLKDMGVEWATFIGGVATPLFDIGEAMPTTDPPSIPLNDGGPLRRTSVSASIRALAGEGAAKILSEPKVLIADGHSANILIGGEIPIPIAQTGAGAGSTITIEFKTFGIQLTVKPEIAPDRRVLMTLTPEVSSLDFSNAIRSADTLIPAIRTRKTTSTVHVPDGGTLAIGGLLSMEDVKSVERVPLLSSIPIIGELFKSKRFERNETELVVFVSPLIIENGEPVPISISEQP